MRDGGIRGNPVTAILDDESFSCFLPKVQWQVMANNGYKIATSPRLGVLFSEATIQVKHKGSTLYFCEVLIA
jgi:hypothetical protein